MDRKKVGKSDVEISAIGLGTTTFGREIGEETAFEIMDYALENGITFFDTAEAYGGGQAFENRKNAYGTTDVREKSMEMSSSELIIGRWLKSRGTRKDIEICTKISGGRANAEEIRKSIDASLERLGTDYIDIYKIHAPDVNTSIDETLDELTNQVNLGKTKTIGGSNYTQAQISEMLDSAKKFSYKRFEIMQPNYSLAVPDAENDIFPLCTKEEIAITPYSPLGGGFLTGKYTRGNRDSIPKGTRMDVAPGHIDIYFNDRSFNIVDKLKIKSKELGVPITQLAMAWVMSHKSVTAALAGAKSSDHLKNAINAYNMDLEDIRDEMSSWE
jgi:aryl-alcohol dehydrogenase-like predicted oxidoreductase